VRFEFVVAKLHFPTLFLARSFDLKPTR
jgi:hypothetical protein